MHCSRRAFLIAAASLAGSACAPVRIAAMPMAFDNDPFTLGVASGQPLPDGVVLWTRLAPAPLADGGMPPTPVEVRWEVAADEGFRRVVQHGVARAVPELAHSVHVEVDGLAPGRWYWYRFHAGGAVSPVGRTRTAPAADAAVDRLRFAFASCQQYEQGYYAAYRHMAAEDLDLVIHLGDYIYESSWGRDRVRSHNSPVPATLADYRNRFALYKSDPDLRSAHAAFPWLVTWDDHEVDNDYADDRSQALDPSQLFLTRRAAAYQAYYEHMPLRAWSQPRGLHMQLYHRSAFGRLVEFNVLDGRQYRSHQVCPRPGRGGGNVVELCPERLDPSLTMLGMEQERWLTQGLARSGALWNVIAQQTLMAQVDRKPGAGQAFWTDGWDGYPAARRRLLEFVAQRRTANPVVLSGDVHSFWVNDLKPDFDDPRSPPVATEFVSGSISSQGFAQSRLDRVLPDNPHVKFAKSEQRGYVSVELTPQRWIARMRALDDVKDAASGIYTLAAFTLENATPGAQRSG